MVVGRLKQRSERLLRREIEERRTHEQALRRSEERTRAIITSATDAFVAIDSESRILEWNPQAEKTFGWPRVEVLGKLLYEVLIPPEYKDAHLKGLAQFHQSGEGPILNRRIEVTAMHRDGRRIPVELMVYPIRRKDSVIFGAFLHDISERKKAERLNLIQFSATRIMAEAPSAEEAVPPLLKSIGTGLDWPVCELWLKNKEGTSYHAGLWSADARIEKTLQASGVSYDFSTLGASPAWLSLITGQNLPRGEVLSSAGIQTALLCPIVEAEDTLGVLCLYHRDILSSDGKIMDLMNDLVRHFGVFLKKRWVEEDLRKLSRELELKVDERTRELADVNIKLSREAAEKQILYEQAKTANRLKDEFLATISHELRTPMNVILGHSELLYGSELTEEEKRKSIEAIYRNTKAQVHIVSDILDVSRFITGKAQLNIENVDMEDLVSTAVESVLPAASAKDIQVEEHIAADVGVVRGDPTRLQQVLWNLLSNAVKFTPRHGKVDVTLSRDESNVSVEVKDNGKGIDPSFLPYVFERFRQEDASTTRKFGGLGLGLAITRNIVEAHGGSIQVFS